MTEEHRESTGPTDATSARGPGGRAPARRFGDREIARILQTAVELQERAHAVAHDDGRGLTLDELRQIAEEAGIDPRFVDLAVSDADAPIERRGHALAGGPYSWRFHAEVSGDLDDDDRGRILQAVRSVMGGKGDFADVYGRMEWSLDEGLGPTIVGISSRDGRVEIDVTAMKAGEVGLLFGMAVPFGGMVGGAAVASLLGVSGAPLIAAMAVVSYGASRIAWRLRGEWWERRLRRLVERISSIAQGATEPPPSDEG